MIFCKKHGLSTATAAQSEKIEKATAANPRINISALKGVETPIISNFQKQNKMPCKKGLFDS